MIDDIILEQTSIACPEQYNAFVLTRRGEKKQVGYLRLRRGYFCVEYPTCFGELLYEAEPRGDGCFEADERDFYLTRAKEAIQLRLHSGSYNQQFPIA